jgi:glycosyltransferase involved in cell wall biosynthesis
MTQHAPALASELSSATPPALPRLSVIVPVLNGRLQLPRCLEAIVGSAYPQFEVIVVDDGSTDNTRDIVERWGARYLRTPRRLGPGGARNLGARHAHGDVLLFVDADVVVGPDVLPLVAGDFARDPELAAVFGSYDDAPAWSDFLSQYKNLMHHYVHQTAQSNSGSFWAGCGAVRRDVFLEFAGFNAAKYPEPSIEDIELGFRLSRAGRRILLDKRVQVKHLKKWTVRGLLRADIRCRAVPWTELILVSGHLPSDLNLDWASRLSAALVGFLVAGLGLLFIDGVAPLPIPGFSAGRVGIALAFIALLLLLLNRRTYFWFMRKRGVLFAAGAVLAHWAYYFYSGVVYVLVHLRHVLLPRPAPPGGVRPEPL